MQKVSWVQQHVSESHDTRKVQLHVVPKHRTITYGKWSFKYSAAHIWNELDKKYKQDVDLRVCYCYDKYVEWFHMWLFLLYPMRFKQDVMQLI